jgi:methylmalonyl-CoA/ethylmalonyl-CoA epimerase
MPALGHIAQIALTVRDVAESIPFYRDVLGLPHLPIPAPTLAFFDCDGIRLMLTPPEGEFTPGGSVLYFKVDDLDAEYAACLERGATFFGEPHLIAKLPDHELWMAFLRDPSGNALALMSERS